MTSPSPRLDWVDNFRTAMIVLVINMHACVTYSFIGSWYFNAPPAPEGLGKLPFALWQATLQSFFMGALFFLGGYFADRSLSRKPPKEFLAERTRRLALPALLYMLVVQPFIVFIQHPGYAGSDDLGRDYSQYVMSGKFLGSSGPMWFAAALFIFCVVLIPVYRWIPRPTTSESVIKWPAVLAIAVATGLLTFLVRTAYPIGLSVQNFQFCFFPQYLVAFPLGIWISRRSGLLAIAENPGSARYGLIALIGGPIVLLGLLLMSLPLPKEGNPPFVGGWNVSALSFAVWEQLTGFGLAAGGLALFRRYVNQSTPVSKWLSDHSFAVYMIHTPILVALALALQPVRTAAIPMAIILTLLGVPLSFAAAAIMKRTPLLREIL